MAILRSLLAAAATAVVFGSTLGAPGVPAAVTGPAEASVETAESFFSMTSTPSHLRAPHAAQAPVYTGQAFDSCSAPTLALMRAWWRSSPYRATGIYIGGANRACAQPELSRGWVRAVDRIGWRLLPVYVGSQAPCVRDRNRATKAIDPRRTLQQGRSEGTDAVRIAAALGIAPGSPLYLDIENYARGNPACTLTVLQYATAWTTAVRASGYLAGFYSSDDSGIADMAAADAVARSRGSLRCRPLPPRHAPPAGRAAPLLPDAIWYARWDAHPGTADSGALGHYQWSGHHRVHQYTGDRQETHAGLTQWIDRDSVDAPVAIVN